MPGVTEADFLILLSELASQLPAVDLDAFPSTSRVFPVGTRLIPSLFVAKLPYTRGTAVDVELLIINTSDTLGYVL